MEQVRNAYFVYFSLPNEVLLTVVPYLYYQLYSYVVLVWVKDGYLARLQDSASILFLPILRYNSIRLHNTRLITISHFFIIS